MGSRASQEQPAFEFPQEGGFEEPNVVKRPPKPGEKGYLEPEFHRDDEGRIMDDQNNVYDERYQIIEEGLRPELQAEVDRIEADPERYPNLQGPDKERSRIEIAKIVLREKNKK